MPLRHLQNYQVKELERNVAAVNETKLSNSGGDVEARTVEEKNDMKYVLEFIEETKKRYEAELEVLDNLKNLQNPVFQSK